MYSFINMLLSKIFGVLIKNTLRRFEWYRNLELRVKNSEAYLRARAAKKKFQAMENSVRIAAARPNAEINRLKLDCLPISYKENIPAEAISS